MQEVPGDRQEASGSSGRHPAHRPFQPLRITTGASHRRLQRPHGRSDCTKMENMPRLAGAHTGHIHHDSPEFPKYTCQRVSVFSPRPGCRGGDRIHCGKARKRATCFTGICIREKAVCGSPCPQYTFLWIALAELRLTCLAGTAASSTASIQHMQLERHLNLRAYVPASSVNNFAGLDGGNGGFHAWARRSRALVGQKLVLRAAGGTQGLGNWLVSSSMCRTKWQAGAVPKHPCLRSSSSCWYLHLPALGHRTAKTW